MMQHNALFPFGHAFPGYNSRMGNESLEYYLRHHTQSFAEAPLCDVDLMAFSALMYAEFERSSHFADERARTRIGELARYATAAQYVENDFNPSHMKPFMEAIIESPRFAGVALERFRCIVDEKRVMQFAAACFPLPGGQVVVAFRGTDKKLVGWHECFNLAWLPEGPGEEEALRYLEDAACAYPDAPLILCGHSKGGGFAEHAAVYAPNDLLARIHRVVSFDGPGLFRLGDTACPEFGDLDVILMKRYARLPFPVARYVFPSAVGLMLERRDPTAFPFVETLDSAFSHDICSVRIVDGRIATRIPQTQEIDDATTISRWVASLSIRERRFIGTFIVNACRKAGITFNVLEPQALAFALIRAFTLAGVDEKLLLMRIARLAHGASRIQLLP